MATGICASCSRPLTKTAHTGKLLTYGAQKCWTPRPGRPARAGDRASDEQVQLAPRVQVDIARVYGLAKEDGHYVLVDRLWPRGVARATAPFDEWLKDVSPSTELRKWYGHRPERFEEFARRYGQELTNGPGRDALEELRRQAGAGRLVLVTATKDLQHSEAAVLQVLLRGK